MKHAFINFSGTLVKHINGEKIPMMQEVLNALANSNWNISVFSKSSEVAVRNVMKSAGIVFAGNILTLKHDSLGALLSEQLEGVGGGDIILIDDNPENLLSVKKECEDSVRVIGFAGSGKYLPEISSACRGEGIELALSPVDLCEGLNLYVDSYGLFRPLDTHFSQADLFMLIPGMDHPASAICGETAHFDHRAPVSLLRDGNWAKVDLYAFWSAVAWISCDECIWKLLSESVSAACSPEVDNLFKGVMKADQYTEVLLQYLEKTKNYKIIDLFEVALQHMKRGIETTGHDAEFCRIADRAMDPYRMDKVARRVMSLKGIRESCQVITPEGRNIGYTV